jgi:hypothetical protein
VACSIAANLFVRLVGTLPFNRRGCADVLGLTHPARLVAARRRGDLTGRAAGRHSVPADPHYAARRSARLRVAVLRPGLCRRRRRLAQSNQGHHTPHDENNRTDIDRSEMTHPVVVEMSHVMQRQGHEQSQDRGDRGRESLCASGERAAAHAQPTSAPGQTRSLGDVHSTSGLLPRTDLPASSPQVSEVPIPDS